MTRVFVPWLKKEEKVIIVGNSARLGMWDPESGIILSRTTQFIYRFNLKIKDNEQWKIVVASTDKNYIWEEGDNRLSNPGPFIWFRGGRKATGISLPLYSLRGVGDNGIGDFYTLQQFLKEIKEKEYKIVQLLPINDTGKKQNPYHIISAFAFNPIYINLDQMGVLEDVEIAHSIADITEQISYSPIVEWEDVIKIKWDYFEAIYRQDGDKTINSKPFKNFLEKEKEWLIPYAAFCYLSEKYKTDDFDLWGNDVSSYSNITIDKLTKDSETRFRIFFYIYLQYHAYMQFNDVKRVARNLGITLHCKTPTMVYGNSADVWINPKICNRKLLIGTEPNSRYITGQKLSYNPINWNHAQDWWIKRLKHMNRYFDICTLENINNVFRSWVIPNNDETALKGYYSPSLDASYTEKNIKKAGFQFDRIRDIKPRMTRDYILKFLGEDFRRFGEFFKRDDENYYNFKQNMSRNCDLVNYFKNRKGDESDLMNNLIRLQDECLFIDIGGKYIPRIASQYTNGYTLLSDEQKIIFNSLYDNFYYKQNNGMWGKNGQEILKLISSKTKMLFCSEDFENYADFINDTCTQEGIIQLRRSTDANSYMSITTSSTFNSPKYSAESRREEYCNEISHDYSTIDLVRCKETLQKIQDSSSALSLIKINEWIPTIENKRNENDFNEYIISAENIEKWSWRVPRLFTLESTESITAVD